MHATPEKFVRKYYLADDSFTHPPMPWMEPVQADSLHFLISGPFFQWE